MELPFSLSLLSNQAPVQPGTLLVNNVRPRLAVNQSGAANTHCPSAVSKLSLPRSSSSRSESPGAQGTGAGGHKLGSQAQEPGPAAPQLSRRRALAGAAVAAAAALGLRTPDLSVDGSAGIALAEAAEAAETSAPAPTLRSPTFEAFDNQEDRYTLQVPAEWTRGTGKAGTRKVVAFHPEATTDTNVSILITPLGADYTSLGSFGTAAAFGEALVNGLDRSYLRKPGQKAELIDTKSTKDMYYVEYTLQKPGEAKVHLLSAVAINFNGIYNQFYTLTAQYVEDDAAQYEATIRRVVDSFKLTS